MTSDTLLRRFPGLAEREGWNTFREKFDDPACIDVRASVKVSHEPPQPRSAISELRSLCFSIEHYDFFCGPEWLLIPPHTFATYEEKIQWLVDTSRALADRVNTLLSDSNAGENLREHVRSDLERQKSLKLPKGERHTGMWQETALAFMGFIERENRLPSKKELNLEVGRKFRVVRHLEYGLPLSHGQIIQASRVWRVQRCVENFRLPIAAWPDEPVTYAVELIDCSSGDGPWNDPRWRDDTFSKDVVKSYGFAGLPRHRNR